MKRYNYILIFFLIPNVIGKFIDVGDNRYTSKDVRICLFGTMNETHYDLHNIVVPNLVKLENVIEENAEKYGCGIDVSKCSNEGRITFGIYQNNPNAFLYKMKNMPQHNVGLTNDPFVAENIATFTKIKSTNAKSDRLNANCALLIAVNYIGGELKSENNDFLCPGIPSNIANVSASSKEDLCELRLTIDNKCNVNVEQKVVKARSKFFEYTTQNAKMNLYCTGNFCPLMLMGVSATFEIFNTNSWYAKCLKNVQQTMKKYQPLMDKYVCETIEKQRDEKLMKNDMWEELLQIYKCTKSTSVTPIPITTIVTTTATEPTTLPITIQASTTTIKPTEVVTASITSTTVSTSVADYETTELSNTETAKDSTINNNDYVEEMTLSFRMKNSSEITVTEHSQHKKKSLNISLIGVILLFFIWLEIILTSCLLIFILWKFKPENVF